MGDQRFYSVHRAFEVSKEKKAWDEAFLGVFSIASLVRHIFYISSDER
jgi:hypothetical protein